MKKFRNRVEAGRKLAEKIKDFDLDWEETVCLALPRGGVPVAYEISKELDIPLDVVVSRKIGAPFNPEFAIGAISENGAVYFNQSTISSLNVDSQTLDKIEREEKEELRRRIDTYRKGKSLPSLKGKEVLLVDDGLATGATARAAISFLKQRDPKSIIFCAPVCALDTSLGLEKKVDRVVCSLKPRPMSAIGLYYVDFGQTSDEEVLELLNKSRRVVD